MGSRITDEFTGLPEEVMFSGLLFDMDGTIIDSTDAVVNHWQSICNEIGVDPKVILKTSHGRRTMDVLKDLDPSKANWEYISHIEGQVPLKYGSSAVEIHGARSLISSLSPQSIPWAIVTSGTRALVTGWLSVLKLPPPEHLVVAEDVEQGKPDPACYVMGLKKLQMEANASQVLVIEDSPAGIRAGKAAGCKVLAVVTSHTSEQVANAGADWVVRDLSSVKVVGKGSDGKGVTLEIKDALVTA